MGKMKRILIFTGDGKGKTTAAMGMALRASGHGLRTLIIQFLKADESTGEKAAFAHVPHVHFVQMGLGFVPPKSSPRFAAHRDAAFQALRHADEAIGSGEFDMVILDEACTALSLDLLDEESICSLIRESRPDGPSIVLTGRGATAGLLALADTATEMRSLKHGFDSGLPACEGVEF